MVPENSPARLFQGTVVLTVPHMDDGVLACGGTIAQLPRKERIHVIYATDGKGSPAPVLPWRDAVSPELDQIRMQEAREAMAHLGVPEQNIRFLALPDGRLHKHAEELDGRLRGLIQNIKPAHLLIPFRYDRHRDHLTLNRVVTRALRDGAWGSAGLSEYFVYHRWRLLPQGDIRRYIHPNLLFEVDIDDVSARKRGALEHFRSQTTRFYPWQTRPNLTPALLDEVSRATEVFLRYDSAFPGSKVFTGSVAWILLAHLLEPRLKKAKDQVVALARRLFPSEG